MANRRQFLQLILRTAAADAVSALIPTPRALAATGERVLVIGAGVAGLAAAQALHAQGARVTVLEGRDRVGGRVWTSRAWPDLPIDLGASWIHGATGNPLTALSDKLGLRRVPTDDASSAAFSRKGAAADTAADAAERLLSDILEDLDTLRAARQAAGKPDISLAQGIEQVLIDHGAIPPDDLLNLKWAISSAIEYDYAADAAALSLYHWDADDAFGGPELIFPDGYDAIPLALARDLDVRLDHAVSAVKVTSSGVTAATSRGSFDADRCVITLPLGVLKAGAVTFSPPLPKPKADAIRRLGSGLLNKLCLKFPTPFWSERLGEELLHVASDAPGEWSETLNLQAVLGVPALLMFSAADAGRRLERLPDADLIAKAMTALRGVFGPDIPDPVAAQVTRWASDPFALGSYSFCPVGAGPSDREALAAPVGDRLFFAGEATHAAYSSTVHGAYMSGLREAARFRDGVLLGAPAGGGGDDDDDDDDE